MAARHRFREPSPDFLNHTLRVAEICVIIHQVSRKSSLIINQIQTEPNCWRDFAGAYGNSRTLKPDLYAELSDREYDYFAFFEADLASEHQPVIAKKAAVYQAYWRSGREQNRHDGVFPLIVWITPDSRRAAQILATIREDKTLDEKLHTAVAVKDFANYLARLGGGA
jgi:hypothetical protein